jgi:hypothetical protein
VALVRKRWISWIARWGARTFGTLAACVFFLFLLGEGFGPRGWYTLNPFVLTAPDLIVILLRLTACLGLLLAWRWEALGGGIAVVCILIATVLRPWVPGMVLALAVPGVLYLLSGLLRRESHPR